MNDQASYAETMMADWNQHACNGLKLKSGCHKVDLQLDSLENTSPTLSIGYFNGDKCGDVPKEDDFCPGSYISPTTTTTTTTTVTTPIGKGLAKKLKWSICEIQPSFL